MSASTALIVVPLTLAVMTCSLTGLIAVWAAISRLHWFLRIAALEAFLALWLIIPAYEILLVLFVQSVVVVLSLLSLRLLHRGSADPGGQTPSDTSPARPVRLQFSLRSLLLATLALACFFAAVTDVVRNTANLEYSVWTSPIFWGDLLPYSLSSRFPRGSHLLASPWGTFVFFGMGAGLGTLVAVWVALGRDVLRVLLMVGLIAVLAASQVLERVGPWFVLSVALLIPIAAWFALRRRTLRVRLSVFVLTLPLAALPLCGSMPWFGQVLLYPISLCIPLAAWLALLRWAGWPRAFALCDNDASPESRRRATTRPSVRRCAQGAAALVSLLMVLPLGIVFYELATPIPIPQVELPDPNGYHDLVQAGALLESIDEPDDVETATTAQLRTFVAKCTGAFETARCGLSRECRVPIKYSIMGLLDIQAIRGLTRAFLAEGELAEREGRTRDATKSYLDATRLGPAAARGGLLVDALFGRALEGIGIQQLHETSSSLTPRQCRDAINQLQRVADQWEPIERFVARDRIFTQHVFRWQGRLGLLIASLAGQERDWHAFDHRNVAEQRLLICELALRAYHVELGEFPETLGDLTPEYLSAIPEDPYSGSPLIYRRTSAGYLIYSVGPDGKDDGGRPMDPTTDLDDIMLDEPSGDATP